MYIYVYTQGHITVDIYIYICIHTGTHYSRYIYIYVYTQGHITVDIYIYIYIYMYTHRDTL